MTYAEVVEKAKREIKKRRNYGTKEVPFKRCEIWENGDQINLWTYWQGYQIEDVDKGVDILLVGQDWGNPWRKGSEESVRYIKAIQQGDDEQYVAKTPTDKMLTEVFLECFKCEIWRRDPGLRLFFTNYSLGYRNGSETGGMKKEQLLKDKELFDDLVTAIKPKSIICLGKLVYEAVSGTTAKDFVKKLSDGVPFKATYPPNNTIPVYGVAHCGARGVSNVRGKEPIILAWKSIAKEFEQLYKQGGSTTMLNQDLLDVLKAHKSYWYLRGVVTHLTGGCGFRCEEVEGLNLLYEVIWRNSKFAGSDSAKDEEAFNKIMYNEKLSPEEKYSLLVK